MQHAAKVGLTSLIRRTEAQGERQRKIYVCHHAYWSLSVSGSQLKESLFYLGEKMV